MPSDQVARKAFDNLKLSTKRIDDALPPLTLYLADLQDIKKKEFE